MTVNREYTEIFDREDQMFAEGTSVCEKNNKPLTKDIKKLIDECGFRATKIEIWFDTLQKFYRWNCYISKK